MSMATPEWASAIPAGPAVALAACAAGRLPLNVALMRLLAEAAEEGEAERALAAALAALNAAGRSAETERLQRLEALWHDSPQAWAVVRSVLADADHQCGGATGEAAIARWAAIFDRLAGQAPEAAVALYSLGRRDLLAAATAELVRLLRGWGLLGPHRSALDLGCGIGRHCAALAPELASVTGIDVSAAMIAAARRRCAGLANVRLMATGGRDLQALADNSFDLVLAVDVFPYLVQAGMAVAVRHVAEAPRVLRPGGTLAIFNFSYRGDLDADRADIARLARSAGFKVLRNGTRELRLWDGAAFHLVRRDSQTHP